MHGYTNKIEDMRRHIARYQGYHLPKIILTNSLQVRIFGSIIVSLDNTPHYQYIIGNKDQYMGFLHQYNHPIEESLRRFEDVIHGPWDYLDGPHEQKFIECDPNLVIVDGVHRAVRLFQLGIKVIPVVEVR